MTAAMTTTIVMLLFFGVFCVSNTDTPLSWLGVLYASYPAWGRGYAITKLLIFLRSFRLLPKTGAAKGL